MSSSRCKQCGEKIVETGNYSFKILPAKRIPKKARKLMKSSEGLEGGKQQQRSSSWGITKFRKFLEERSKPANFLELTCGKCGGVSKIKMEKTFTGGMSTESSKEISIPSSSSIVISDKPVSKKKKKDVTAGLTLPSSSLYSHSSSRQEVGRPTANLDQKNQRNNQSNQRGGGRGRGAKRPAVSNAQKEAKRKTDLESLNKILFQSKKAKKSGSTLEDFLSSI